MKRKVIVMIGIISLLCVGCSSTSEKEYYNFDELYHNSDDTEYESESIQTEIVDTEKQETETIEIDNSEVQLESEELQIDNENVTCETQQDVVWDYEFYYNVLEMNTDLYIDTLIVDDFDCDGIQEAFAFIVSDEECFSGMGNCAEIWYLYGEQCTVMNKWVSDLNGGIEAIILDNTKMVIVRDDNEGMGYTGVCTMDYYYTVNNAEPELLFDLCDSSIDENGVISSSRHGIDEDGGQVSSFKHMYINGELVLVE